MTAHPARFAGIAALAVSSVLGCGGDAPPDPPPVVVTTELSTAWRLLQHRLSSLEIAFRPDDDGLGGTLVGENAGGPFASVDDVTVTQGLALHTSSALATVALSVDVDIAPTGTTNPEDFVATVEGRASAAGLATAGPLVALLRGFRLSTDEYESPPPFEIDPVMPYDPTDGFTSQGLGVVVGEPRVEGGEVVVPITVRNALGPCDRADMNAAIPAATSFLRVDVLVLGASGVASAASRGEAAYFLSTATYGTGTVHPHAPDGAQETTLAGTPGLRSAVIGLAGFEVWVNAPGRIDPACVVVQDELNFMDEPVSGPGRYLTEISARLWDRRYDAASGTGRAKVDLHVSNRSTAPEIGNVCAGLRGEVAMLQLDADVRVSEPPAQVMELDSGAPMEAPIRFDVMDMGGMP